MNESAQTDPDEPAVIVRAREIMHAAEREQMDNDGTVCTGFWSCGAIKRLAVQLAAVEAGGAA